ncbi:MAG: FtsX-like permease family protein [Steroidobacteraceae bacterium]
MRAIVIGLRTLAREWRSGDLAVLFAALVVAVAALTGVGFLVDRVDRGMKLTASEVLAGDLRLTSTQPIVADYEGEARAEGLESSGLTSLLSVVLLGEASQLSNVHAVQAGYPLRGTVKLSSTPFGPQQNADGIPGAGEAWPDSRLAAALNASIGSELDVGSAKLRVSRILISRPDQGSGFVDLAPSLLMNAADLPATQLVQPGSRITYAKLFAGTTAEVQRFQGWLGENKLKGERLREVSDASPAIGNASSRAGRFLSLASLTSVLLCAIAVALTARRYMQRHLDITALLKTLGATQRFVLTATLTQLLVIASVATLGGAAIGFGAQAWLVRALKDLLTTDLPAPSIAPLIMGFGTAVLVLIGFALPSILQLARVPAIRILRRDVGPPQAAAVLAYGPAVIAVALLMAWTLKDAKLALGFIGGLLATLVILAAAALGLVRLVSRFRGRVGVAWRYGLANLDRRRTESVAQIVAFGLGLTAMLLLAVIRGDLVQDWRASVPASAPNFFFINIPPAERDAFRDFLATEGATTTRMLPMVRGRMTQINGTPVDQRNYGDRGDENFAQREQNLSWSLELGDSNTIEEGRWFTEEDEGKPLVSAATEIRERLGVKLGDELTFDIAGETFTVKIASFRNVKWDSLQPNFFLMFPTGLLDATAGTWLTSARLEKVQGDTVARLVRRFPSVSVFDTDDLLRQVRSLIDKAVLAVQSVFIFTLFAGLTVLLAAVQATRDERRFESAMLRTLGARRATVWNGLLVEFGAIGLLAGALAAAIASIGGWVLATRVLDVPYRPDPLLWLLGLGSGGLLVAVAGLLATRSAVSQPPLQTLREG